MAPTILVVDDERDIGDLLEFVLTQEGFRVVKARDGRAALDAARRSRPDLVLLDIMLPEISGVDVLKQLRRDKGTLGVPVILLTARQDEMDRVLGFELGADDYVTKPFSPREVVLRVRAVLNRHAAPEPPPRPVEVGPLELDADNHSVRVQGRSVHLTLTEFRLLADLVQARGRVRTRDTLLTEVWGYQSDVESRTIDTHVRRLRSKLGVAAKWLASVRGVGYRFRDPVQE